MDAGTQLRVDFEQERIKLDYEFELKELELEVKFREIIMGQGRRFVSY